MDTTKLQPGQPIAFWTRAYMRLLYDNVAKVTPSGIVELQNGRRFNKQGKEIKSAKINYPGCTLMDYEAAKAYDARVEKQNQINHTVRELINSLNGCQSMNGNYHLDQETTAQIKALTESLKTRN